VEIASHYFIQRLGLGSYLYDRHYPKNGLRFFFDSESKDTPLQEMTEIGSDGLPFFPAFQVDRIRLESDLNAMNQRAGVEVHYGVKAGDLRLGTAGAPHRFSASGKDGTQEYEARWVVDGTGRSRVIARLEDLNIDESELQNASIWGWFEGVTDIDSLGPESFRERVRYTARRLSTLHFLYRGYWIWFIPLANGITSIGVVCEREYDAPQYHSKEGFLEFLRGHSAVAQLLENAKPMQTRSFRQLAYGTKRFFSPDRWGCVGESSAFPDPFYSPGADFVSLGCDFMADLIARDLGGEDEAALKDRVELYDEFMKFRVNAALLLYRDQYSVFGSYEACKLKWDFDIGCYYNLWLSSFIQKEHLDARALRRQLASRDPVLNAIGSFAKLFRKVDDHLTARGEYFRSNRGEYNTGQDCLDFAREIGTARSPRETLETTARIFNTVRNRALDILADASEPTVRDDKPVSWFMTPRDLGQQ
jgi:flavin-dependent dehydrogenase